MLSKIIGKLKDMFSNLFDKLDKVLRVDDVSYICCEIMLLDENL